MLVIETKNNFCLSGGFTIIETLIALTISIALGLVALTTLTQNLNHDNFSTAVNDFSQSIQKAIVNTSSGYYSYSGLDCTGSASQVSITSGTNTQGSNDGCVYLGSAIQLAPYGEPGQFITIPVAGDQYVYPSTNNIAMSISASQPIALGANDPAGVSNLSTIQNLQQGLKIVHVKVEDSDGDTVIPTPGMIAILYGDSAGNLAMASGDNLNSTAQSTALYYINNTTTGLTAPDAANDVTASNLYTNGVANIAKDIQICISNDQTSDLLTINGTNTSQISTQIYENDASC